MEERLDVKASQDNVDNGETLKELRVAVDNVIQFVDVMCKVAPRKEFEEVSKLINELINETMMPVMIRMGRRATKSTEESFIL